MSRTETTTRTIYTFAELSDTAKETAREEWSRFLWEDGSAAESMTDLAESILDDAGLTMAPGSLTFQLYVQNNGPHFEADGDGVMIPGAELSWTIRVRTRHIGGGSYTFDVDVYHVDGEDIEDVDVSRKVHTLAEEWVEALARQVDRAMYEEDDYQSSEEQVAEASEANGYEYDEDGHLA